MELYFQMARKFEETSVNRTHVTVRLLRVKSSSCVRLRTTNFACGEWVWKLPVQILVRLHICGRYAFALVGLRHVD